MRPRSLDRSAVADLRDRWESAILHDTTLPNGVRITAWCLRHYADRDGRVTVGIGRMADDTNRDPKTVHRHLDVLVERKYIDRALGQGEQGLGGTTALTTLKVPEVVTRIVTTSPTEVVTQVGTQVGTKTEKSSDTLCPPNHKKPFKPKDAHARARENAPAPADKERRQIIDLAKMFGIEQNGDDWPTFSAKVTAANDRRLAALAERRGHGTTH
jgi:hypothetical protein